MPLDMMYDETEELREFELWFNNEDHISREEYERMFPDYPPGSYDVFMEYSKDVTRQAWLARALLRGVQYNG